MAERFPRSGGRNERPGDGLLGRGRELAAIALACESARAGNGSLLLLSGPPGAGKSALCEAATSAARAEGFAVGWSSCWAVDGAPPAWPWHDLLGQLGGSAPAGTGFAELTALAEALRSTLAPGPAVLVLDELERADRATLEATRFLAGQVRSMPLVVLAAHRSRDRSGRSDTGEVGEINDLAWDELARASVSFSLGGLDLDDVAELLARHGIGSLPTADLELVGQITGGVPAALERAVAAIPGGPRDQRASVLVTTLVEGAVASLPAGSRRVGAAAAVLGPTRLELLLSLSDAGAEPGVVVDLELAGLAMIDAPDVVRLSHPVVVDVLAKSLGPSAVADVHARAVDGLEAAAASSSSMRVRRAGHALLAGSRSPADAERAVAIAVAVAADLAASNDHPRAATMLADAVALYQAAGLGRPPAPLLAAHADAVLHCGRLAAARPLFEGAVASALEQGDPASLARGAIGLGGVWLNEHRSPLDRQRILALNDRALAELPPAEAVLRARLAMRHAAEIAYSGGPAPPVHEALAVVRALGDPFALAEALSLYHHLLLGPAQAEERRAAADELVAVAAIAGDELFSLMGLMWLTVDRFLDGDPLAERSLRELHDRAEALPCDSIAYVARTMDVMQQLRVGDFAAAAAAVETCFRFGVEVGDADALAYYGSQLFSLRWLQGRGHEVLDAAFDTAASPTLTPGNNAFTAAAACLAAEAGDEVRAWAALDRLHEAGLAALPQSSAWLVTLAIAMEAAHLLRDEKTAAVVIAELSPFAHLPVMGSIAVVCLGSCERPLGLAADVLGDLDGAADHLARAVVHSERLGNRPMAAMSRVALADVLARRGAGGDRASAIEHLGEAVAVGERSGLSPRVDSWKQQLEVVVADTPARPAAGRRATDVEASIGRRGSSWLLRWAGGEVVVADRLGMGYLATLLANPGREISAAVLVGAGEEAGGGAQPVLDERALAEYRRRIVELQEELAEAEDFHDAERASLLETELDALVAEVQGQTGLGGRARAFAASDERARTAVQKAVRRALDAIEAADADLGRLLRLSVQTGRRCCYRPGPGAPPTWRSDPLR